MPAQNAEATIAAAITSILIQSYEEFELWILESGSKDRTLEIAKSFTDPRVKVFNLDSMDFQATLEYALENARSDWLARMDADDICFPDRFREQLEIIKSDPEIVLVGTRCVYLTPFGHIVETRPDSTSREIGPLNMRLPGNDSRFFADGSVIFKRSVALDVGGYDPEFIMGDVPLWYRMLCQGRGWELSNPMYIYRLLPNSLSHKEIAPSDELLRFLNKYTPELIDIHFPDSADKINKPELWHTQKFWLRIAAYEALTGNRDTILQAVSQLKNDGPFRKEATMIKLFTYFGCMGTLFFRWYRRNKYRHRPDMEIFLTSLFGSLIPAQANQSSVYG